MISFEMYIYRIIFISIINMLAIFKVWEMYLILAEFDHAWICDQYISYSLDVTHAQKREANLSRVSRKVKLG